ncbi:MAG TPA: TetR family transcriptional regulator [Caulobacteraceae bacterium]
MDSDRLERALAALNSLCGERPWREVSLRDVAERAEIPLAELYRDAPSKTALIDHLGARLDEATLATAATPSDDPHDRLFDAAMARIEAMAPWRDALAGVDGSAIVPLLPHLPRSARAILEAAGVEATPPRLAAMTLVWARIVQVWRADEGALNRTMAEIDRRLKQMRERLRLLGAGF